MGPRVCCFFFCTLSSLSFTDVRCAWSTAPPALAPSPCHRLLRWPIFGTHGGRVHRGSTDPVAGELQSSRLLLLPLMAHRAPGKHNRLGASQGELQVSKLPSKSSRMRRMHVWEECTGIGTWSLSSSSPLSQNWIHGDCYPLDGRI